MDRPIILRGNGSGDLARCISVARSIPIADCIVEKFGNGETRIDCKTSVRGYDVIVVQSFPNKVVIPNSKGKDEVWTFHDFEVELYDLVDIATRGEARSVTVVIPYFPNMRSDKKDSRSNIGASRVARTLEMYGVQRVITMDLHNAATQSAFMRTVPHNLYAKPILIKAVLRYLTNLKQTKVVSPDNGGLKRVDAWAKSMQLESVPMHKKRDYSQASVVTGSQVMGDVDGYDCILVDDIGDTMGTLAAAAKELKSKGAKQVIAVVTHGVFSQPAFDTLQTCNELDRVLCTNTIPQHMKRMDGKEIPHKVEVVDASGEFIEVIRRLQEGLSISDMFLETVAAPQSTTTTTPDTV